MFPLDSPQQLMMASAVLGSCNVVLMWIGRRDTRRLEAILHDLNGATAPTLAVPLDATGAAYAPVLARLVRRGLVREALPGHFYRVESAWSASRDRQRRRAIPFWAAIIAIPLLMVWLMS